MHFFGGVSGGSGCGMSLTWNTDLVAPNFISADLTKDSAWHSLDLSAIVPATCVAVFMRIHAQATSAGRIIYVSKSGFSNFYNTLFLRTQVAATPISQYGIVPVVSQAINYYVQNVSWTIVEFTICGWFT